MTLNFVTLEVGGLPYHNWATSTITAGALEATRSFTLTATEVIGPILNPWIFVPGTPVKLRVDGEVVIDGYIEIYSPNLMETDHPIGVSGRSKSCDFVDCSAIYTPGQWQNKTPLEIAQDLDKFGVGFSTDQELKKVPKFAIQQGETAHAAISRLLQSQKLFMQGMADGSIMITRAGEKRMSGAIVEGVNGTQIQAKLDFTKRFSDYIYKGQKSSGTGADSTEIEESVKDEAVTRYRPLLVLDQSDAEKQTAKERAQAEKDRRVGESISASATIPGWRTAVVAGELWKPNYLVYTHSPSDKLSQDMVIKRMTMQQGFKAGTTTSMELVDPRALHGKKPGKTGSGGSWDVG